MPNLPPPSPPSLLELALREVGTHGLILLDPEGVVVGWHAGAERLLGWKSDEILGQNVRIIFTQEDLQNDLASWEQQTADGSGESEDDRWQVRKDGGRIWVSGTLTALRDRNGRLQGFAKIVRNRTDQKLQLETLEQRIAALNRADERKNQFIAMLAHELRNPLGAIANACTLLGAGEPASPDTALAVGVIRRQAEFMGRMLQDLMEVTRLATGKVTLQKDRIPLQEIIRQAIEVCLPKIEGQAHELQVYMPEAPIELNVDRLRLRQALVNLLENAAKYTHYGGTIWIKATIEGNEAVVRVQDTGIGITPDVMPHIFDLFTQGDVAPASEAGLGIGLSVVKDVVNMHGGSVQATSDGLGKGSEFTVRLPLWERRGKPPQHPNAV